MAQALPLRFKLASEPAEFEQIHQLNYRTFVDEIPQHDPNPHRVLVDRRHADNTYVVCLRGRRLLGMISVCGKRPFSLDHKLADLDSYLPPTRKTCEIRLLAVEPEHRNGVVFRGLVECLAQHCLGEGYDVAVISGTVRQLKLYRHIGFIPFGPLVGAGEALFQPMYLTLKTFRKRSETFARRPPGIPPVSYLPGPVEVASEVRRAMQMPAESHRGSVFVSELNELQTALCTLTGARHVQLLLGSGTLANDVVAGQLSLLRKRGLVLSNGEFGERLADHASRWNLSFSCLRQDWGSVFTREAVETALDEDSAIGWVWAVHCETSTGILNDLEMLREVCAARGIHLCMDCISSLGTVPVDLEGVRFATGVSGKGLGSLAGISLVCHNHEVLPTISLPRYLDLGLYAARGGGVPFTHSSNLVRALRAAVTRLTCSADSFAALARDAFELRTQLRARGFHILAEDASASPAVTTLVLPLEIPSEEFGARLEKQGYLISYRSEYLHTRNWVQICLMGCYREDRLEPLVGALYDAATGANYLETAVSESYNQVAVRFY